MVVVQSFSSKKRASAPLKSHSSHCHAPMLPPIQFKHLLELGSKIQPLKHHLKIRLKKNPTSNTTRLDPIKEGLM